MGAEARWLRPPACGLLLVGVVATMMAAPAFAQEQVRPTGLWGRATFGMSRLEQSCDSCRFEGAVTASNFNLTAGYAWSRVAVGLELGAISFQNNQGDVSMVLVTASWYPWSTSGAFLKGGVGSSKFLGTEDADGIRDAEGSGFGAQTELGIDLSMGNLGVTSVVFAQYAHQSAVTAYGTFPAGRNLTQWNFGLAIGLTVF